MCRDRDDKRVEMGEESGVALVTVIMISLLLLTACIAMLSAASNHSRNVTDVLSETKAYYAAESGIQATINVLRGNRCPNPLFVSAGGKCSNPTNPAVPEPKENKITYLKAIDPAASNLVGEEALPPRLSRWIQYNWPTTGTPNRVVIGKAPADYKPLVDTAYSVEVADPDNTQDYTIFTTSAAFDSNPVFGDDPETNPGGTGTKISFIPVTTNTTLFHPQTGGLTVGSFRILSGSGGSAPITGELRFQIDVNISKPREFTKSIRGKIVQQAGQIKVLYDAFEYTRYGAVIDLCQNSACTLPATLGTFFEQQIPAPTTTPQDTPVYIHMTPILPYRLLLRSTGYGPNGAKKLLEAIIQRDLLNGSSAQNPLTLAGPHSGGFVFEPGNSKNVTYCGIDIIDPDDPCVQDPNATLAAVPSIGLTDPDNLAAVNGNLPKTPPNPPPALLGNETVDWLRNPAALNDLVLKYEEQSKPFGYFPAGVQPTNFGEFDTVTQEWKGITYCAGDCDLHGNGGGTLVVRGQLTLKGNFSFTGLIIVTGEDGVIRSGGGNGQILGNLVIAPYDPENLSTFLAPKYDMNGGGISDIIYSSAAVTFDGHTAVTDLMQGVAEK